LEFVSPHTTLAARVLLLLLLLLLLLQQCRHGAKHSLHL
jgi:hypothetical protein